MNASDLWDMFAPEADTGDFASLSLEVITAQVAELRSYYRHVGEPDEIEMTDIEIAKALQGYVGDPYDPESAVEDH